MPTVSPTYIELRRPQLVNHHQLNQQRATNGRHTSRKTSIIRHSYQYNKPERKNIPKQKWNQKTVSGDSKSPNGSITQLSEQPASTYLAHWYVSLFYPLINHNTNRYYVVLTWLLLPHRRLRLQRQSPKRLRGTCEIRRLDSRYLFCARHASHQLH